VTVEGNGTFIAIEAIPNFLAMEKFRAINIDKLKTIKFQKKIVVAAYLAIDPFPVDSNVE